MYKKNGVLIISDSIYSSQSNRVSLPEIIRHNLPENSKFCFRFIRGKGLNDLVEKVRIYGEELSSFSKRMNKSTAYILCGLYECIDGYSTSMFKTHIDSIILELEDIGFDIVFINPIVENGLKGHIGGWYKRCKSVISEKSEQRFCKELKPDLFLNLVDDKPVINSKNNFEIIDVICNDIEQQENNN